MFREMYLIIYSNSSPYNEITVFIPRACEWNKCNKCTSLRVHLLQLSHELASEITVVISLLGDEFLYYLFAIFYKHRSQCLCLNSE